MLSAGTLAKTGKYHFKMNEMAVNEERMERVPAFYWIIEDHVLLALSCKINTTELRRARARVYVPNLKIDFGPFENPYFVAYRCLLDMFHNHRQKIESLIASNQVVDFIFDNQTEKHAIRASWESYINSRPGTIKSLYGAAPRFEYDQISYLYKLLTFGRGGSESGTKRVLLTK